MTSWFTATSSVTTSTVLLSVQGWRYNALTFLKDGCNPYQRSPLLAFPSAAHISVPDQHFISTTHLQSLDVQLKSTSDYQADEYEVAFCTGLMHIVPGLLSLQCLKIVTTNGSCHRGRWFSHLIPSTTEGVLGMVTKCTSLTEIAGLCDLDVTCSVTAQTSLWLAVHAAHPQLKCIKWPLEVGEGTTASDIQVSLQKLSIMIAVT